MRFVVLFVVVLLGCVSTVRLQSGAVEYSREGLGEVPPVEVAAADYTMARAETERSWAYLMRNDPEGVLGFLRDVAFPWRSLGWYGRGTVDPRYYFPGVQVQVVPTSVPAATGSQPAGGGR